MTGTISKTLRYRNRIVLCLPAVVVGVVLAHMMLPSSVKAGPSITAGSASRPASTSTGTLKPTPRRVTFPTDEKSPVELVATYLPSANRSRGRQAPMVVLLHAEGEDRAGMESLASALHSAGMTVLSLDLRGHGESVNPVSLNLRSRARQRDPKLYRNMTNDVEAAYHWLSRQPESDPARFVIVGVKAGGNLALEYSATDKSVDGVVFISPTLGGLGLEPIASLRKYVARRLLLLAGPHERVDAEALGRLTPDATVRVVGDRSGAASEESNGSRDKRLLDDPAVIAMIRDFVVEAAGSSATNPVVASIKGRTFYEPSSREAQRLSQDNLRWYSSAAEAQARGYHPPKSRKSRPKVNE